MKNLANIIPIVTDMISGAFGGAVIGDWIGGYPVSIFAASLGALYMLFYGIHIMRQRKIHEKSPKFNRIDF